ncbi:MAG: hydrogenase [Elusimicrobia bacterium]|nr:hydrogenase [Elusimicrobiota bacterium]
MEQIAQLLLAGTIFLSFALLGTASLSGCVRLLSFQGYCLSLLPIFIHQDGFTPRSLLLVAGMAILKGWLVPKVLLHAIREVRAVRETEPLIGYGVSLLIGLAIVVISALLAQRLPIPAGVRSGLLVPVSLATMMMGLYMTVSRLKALTQVIGYLVFENGIYLFGLLISRDMPWLLEMGVLLDVFAAVLVMGIVIHHISREFDSIHTDRLTQLKG